MSGTVWEESVVNSPNHVLLIALSATMKNTPDVRDWFEDVQGPTSLILSDHRPVPLNFSFCEREGILPLFSNERSRESRRSRNKGAEEKSGTPKLHPKLLSSVLGDKDGGRRRGRDGYRHGRGREQSSRGGRKGETVPDFDTILKDYDSKNESKGEGHRRGRRQSYNIRMAQVPSYPFVVRNLKRRDMLPAIVFIFSRVGCDRAANTAATEREPLVSAEEEAEIEKRVLAFKAEHPGLVADDRIDLVRRGIASHHAGLLPLWKAFVEEMFQDGLVKVVFATETLAAGINMPARTTVISSMSKRRGEEGIVKLSTSEVLQMAGRAGRRGKDTVGYSVIMQSQYEGPIEAFRAVTSDVDALRSHFTPSYGMVLNLLQTRSIDDARSLVDRSFGAFLRRKADRELAELQAAAAASPTVRDAAEATEVFATETAALMEVAAEAERIVSSVDEKKLLKYVGFIERVKAERRALRYVVRQSQDSNAQVIEDTLTFAPPGTRVTIRAAKSGPGQSKGAYRRRKRRELLSAMQAAGRGEGAKELRAYYLDETDEDDADSSLNNVGDDADDDRVADTIEGILLDIGPDFGVTVLFAAACEDGKLHFFTHEHVAELDFETESTNLDVVAPDWRMFDYPERSDWTCVGVDQYTAPLPADLAPLTEAACLFATRRKDRLADQNIETSTLTSVELEEKNLRPEVHAQRERLRYAKSLVTDNELHGNDSTSAALRARRALAQIRAVLREREENASGSKSGGSRSKRKGRKRGHSQDAKGSNDAGLAKEVAALAAAETAAAESAEYESSIFEEFLGMVQVARHYGFIDEDNAVTALGEVGAKIRGENELWATIVLLEPALDDVSPVHLAAVMAAVLSEGMRADAYIAYQASPEATEMISNLAPLRSRLLAVQYEAGLDLPVGLESESVGLVEAWAQGTSWVDILSNTSLQEGDVCRILRRVLDLLRQVPHLPFISDGVKLNAKRSVALFDRFPVVDNRTYQVRENEKAPVSEKEDIVLSEN